MPASYKIDKGRRLVISTGEGRLTIDDILNHMDRISHDPDFDPEFSLLIDFTNVSAVDFGPEEVREFAKRTIYSRHARRAILVKDDLQFGLARMFEIHRELNGEPGIRVCRSLEEAMEWILLGTLSS